MSTLMLDRDAVRAELEKAFDERTSTIMLGVLERVAAQTHAAGVQREDFTELKEIVARLGERMDAAAARQDQFEARMDQLTARIEQLTARVEQLTERVDQLTERLDQLIQVFEAYRRRSENDFSRLKGQGKEMLSLLRGTTIFGRILRKGKDASSLVVESLHQAVEDERLSDQEKNDALAADIFWSGEFQGKTILLVGEISWVVDDEDVERAVRRAARLRSIGHNAFPFVGGEEWENNATALAKSLHVLVAADGNMDTVAWKEILTNSSSA